MTTSKTDYLSFFKPYLKAWSVKTMGAQPTSDELLTCWYWGLSRPGIEALATAMAMRAEGYTVRQYLLASGASGAAHNKQRGHQARGLAKYVVLAKADGSPNAEVKALKPTAKGTAKIEAGKLLPDAEPDDKPVAKATKRNAKKVAKRKVKAIKVTAAQNAVVVPDQVQPEPETTAPVTDAVIDVAATPVAADVENGITG